MQLSDQIVKELEKLDIVNKELILSYLEQRLENCSNPRIYGKPLKKGNDNLWCYSIGRYRLICELMDDTIIVYVKQGGKLMKLIHTIEEWACTLAVSLALALFINIFIVQHMVVEGHSMDPTLHDQEHLVVFKLSHSMNQLPNYGDIVIVDSRVSRERSFKDDLAEPIKNQFKQNYVFVKRVIGKPGDVLEFKDGNVIRNGTKIDEPYILEPMKYSTDNKVIVPNNSIFVMGDNRNNSMDSRFIGNIPLDHVLGVMFAKL